MFFVKLKAAITTAKTFNFPLSKVGGGDLYTSVSSASVPHSTDSTSIIFSLSSQDRCKNCKPNKIDGLFNRACYCDCSKYCRVNNLKVNSKLY